jgi:glycerophosphoryl diester phosphodiesterase
MPPQIIAHRGASGTCPENTMPAFRRAVELGAHMIELDVQCSRDGEVIVLHDDRLERTTSGRGVAVRCAWNELAALDAGRWFAPHFAGTRIPRLADVLREIPITVNVELKAPGGDDIEARALAVVEGAGALERVVFSCFDHASLSRLRALSSRAHIAVLVPGSSARRGIAAAERVGATAVHIRNGRGAVEGVRACHAARLAARVWTVNSPRHFVLLERADADGVFTDFPERFLHSLRA